MIEFKIREENKNTIEYYFRDTEFKGTYRDIEGNHPYSSLLITYVKKHCPNHLELFIRSIVQMYKDNK
jgi:hypothetical protein